MRIGGRDRSIKRMPRVGLFFLLVVGGLVLFLLGNAHLLYVALDSEPACIGHVKVGQQQAGAFAAAQSSC